MDAQGYNLYNGGLAFGLVGLGFYMLSCIIPWPANLKALQRQIFRFTMESANPTGFLPTFFHIIIRGHPAMRLGIKREEF